MKVQRAYLFNHGENARRVLIDSRDRVYRAGEWVHVQATEILRVGERYDRWSDVPEAWIGAVPWWR